MLLPAVELELKRTYRDYFETLFAAKVLTNPNFSSCLSELNRAMVIALVIHEQQIIDIMSRSGLDYYVSNFYCTSFLGYFVNNTNQKHTFASLLNEVRNVLINSENIYQVMYVHYIFAKKILAHFEQIRTEFDLVEATIYPYALFSYYERGRQSIHGVKPTHHPGIIRNKVFSKLSGLQPGQHKRMLDSYKPMSMSSVVREMRQHNLSFVTSISGSTSILLRSAILWRVLVKDYEKKRSPKEKSEFLKEYTLICAAFLITCGSHSFYEVGKVANLIDVPFVPGEYMPTLPDSFIKTKAFDELAQQFPDFLERQKRTKKPKPIPRNRFFQGMQQVVSEEEMAMSVFGRRSNFTRLV